MPSSIHSRLWSESRFEDEIRYPAEIQETVGQGTRCGTAGARETIGEGSGCETKLPNVYSKLPLSKNRPTLK
jgi:hypothetical protein